MACSVMSEEWIGLDKTVYGIRNVDLFVEAGGGLENIVDINSDNQERNIADADADIDLG